MQAQVDPKITIIEETSPDGKSVRVVAQICFDRGGKEWHSAVSGQGKSREDAVENLAKGKLNSKIKSMILAKLTDKGPAPKAHKPSGKPATDGKLTQPEVILDKKEKASSKPVDPEPVTDGPKTSQSPSSEDQEKSPSPKSKTTPKQDGTPQTNQSTSKEPDDAADEF